MKFVKFVKLKKVILTLIILFSIFFIATELFIMKYLKEYGYGIKQLPKTTLVYFHLSKGFTVSTEGKHSIFIGRDSYIYDDFLQKKGYYKSDQMGLVYAYRKEGKDYSADNVHEFHITASNDWCHWFRVYGIGGGYKIEDF